MCGIFCSLSKSDHVLPNATIRERLQTRGPDSTGHVLSKHSRSLAEESTTCLTFYSTVLSLRGSSITFQPLQDSDRPFTLCWNGEAWSINGCSPAGNDTAAVHEFLSDALSTDSNHAGADTCMESAMKISKALSRVAGPHAFVFFDHLRGRLFFGRDFLGRRSLLMKVSSNGDFILSSVSDGDVASAWTEIECDGVHYIDLGAGDNGAILEATPSFHNTWAGFTGGTVPYHFASDPEGEFCVGFAHLHLVSTSFAYWQVGDSQAII